MAHTSTWGCSSGATSTSRARPTAGPRPVKWPMARPNQEKPATTSASVIASPAASVPASDRLRSSTHSQGTRATKPSIQPDPPRA